MGSVPAAAGTDQPQHQRPGWHSPVPYLFGGLAAMLGIIAFALLILACSYWKLSGYLEGGNEGSTGGGDLESGDGKSPEAGAKVETSYEEKIVVIMAGDQEPTFLATPVSTSLVEKDGKNKGVDAVGGDGDDDDDDDDDLKMVVEDGGDAKPVVGICDKRRNMQEGRRQNK